MRLDTRSIPHSSNRHVAVTELLGQTSGRPVRQRLRGPPLGCGQDPGLILRRDTITAPGLEPITEARDPALTESFAPPRQRSRGRAESLYQDAVGHPFGHCQYHLRALHDGSLRSPAATNLGKLYPIIIGELKLVGRSKHERIYYTPHVNAISVTLH